MTARSLLARLIKRKTWLKGMTVGWWIVIVVYLSIVAAFAWAWAGAHLVSA